MAVYFKRKSRVATEQGIQHQALMTGRLGGVGSFSMGIAAVLGSMFLMAAIWASGGIGVMKSAYAHMAGRTIFVDSYSKSFGDVQVGDPVSVSFRLTNGGDKPVRVVGYRAFCNCVVPDDLPFTINPNEHRDFVISVHNSERVNSTGSFTQSVIIYTTGATQPEIALTVKGEIHAVSAAPGS